MTIATAIITDIDEAKILEMFLSIINNLKLQRLIIIFFVKKRAILQRLTIYTLTDFSMMDCSSGGNLNNAS